MNLNECLMTELEKKVVLSLDLKFTGEKSLWPDFKVLNESLN